MTYEDFADWLARRGDDLAACDASCDFSRLLQDIKDEVATWDTGVQEDGSI